MTKLLLVALVLSAGCSTFKVDDDDPSNTPTDAVYQPPPPRQIYDDGPVAAPTGGSPGTGGAGGTSSGGAGGSPSSDAGTGTSRDAPGGADRAIGEPDAPVEQPDAPLSADSGAVGCLACDLLAQDCPTPGQACYPSGASRGCCAFPQAPRGADQFCDDRLECDVGQACVGTADNSFCRVLCSTAHPVCAMCSALGGYPGVGYCSTN